jgi:transcriptional regulator with PAS, ATPase and Fis domain
MELIQFKEQMLIQELQQYKGTVVCIGEPESSEFKRRCRYMEASISPKQFVDRLYCCILEENLSRHQTTPMPPRIDPEIPLVGSSTQIRKIKEQVRAYAQTNEPVLIVGETGTGKNIIAQALHKVSKNTGEYYAVNCSAFSSQLFESEMFGHEKGSFTGAMNKKIGFFEKSHLGTLFLDEIGDLPATLQPKMLKAIEEKIFYRVGGIEQLRSDSRIISATGMDLSKKVSSGQFRIDLFYRISTLSILLPPLRERKEDIPELVNFYLSLHAPNMICTLDSVKRMCDQNWPGNVRQLFGFLARCLTHNSGKRVIEISPEDFSSLYDPFLSQTKILEV